MRIIFYLGIILLTIFFNLNIYANPPYNRLDRQSFNQFAQEINIPLFWRKDANKNNQVDPTELVFLLGMRPDKQWSNYVLKNEFTPDFANAYEEMIKHKQEEPKDPDKINNPEQKRRALVSLELSQGRPTLIESDFTKNPTEDKLIVQHMLNLAATMDQIFLRQNGVYGWDIKIPKDDAASHTLFFRNHGPFCLNPLTENNLNCNALPDKPKRAVGVYPVSLQSDLSFCETLRKHQNAADLTQPFATVIEQNGKLITLPYTLAYKAEMNKAANELKATAEVIKDPKEAAFKSYLLAAANAFTDNNWYQADEAWAKMNATNSKWYFRIGPDERYWEPCSLKAGFHLSFAKINKDSLIWQKKLDPLKEEMESILATLTGPPYRARKVNFHLPDFIDVIINAGDSRHHSGGIMGQSLPNSGPVANEGRGRTVVMANVIMPDEDSRTQFLERSASLLCKKTMDRVVADPKITNMSTVLHEASHNLGPSHEYKVNGKIDQDIFGGQMASMLEELKAQTSAIYFTDWLVSKKMIDQKTADQSYLDNLLWAFRHIATGMYTAEGSMKTYSQLAAIQFGTWVKGGAVTWSDNQWAANGKDKGCFEVDTTKFSNSSLLLEKQVLHIKGSGDKGQAEAMKKEMVDNDVHLKNLRAIITERVLRGKSMTFVYSVNQSY